MQKVTFLFFIFHTFLFSQVIDISQIDTKLDNFEVLYYKDSDTKLEAQYIEIIDFRDRVDNRFTFGYLDHPVWFKLNLHNDSSEKKEIILTLHEPFYDEVEIFYEESDSLVSQKSGVQVELSQRQIKHPSAHFKLSLAPYETKTYYIKLRVHFSTFGEIFLYDTEYYYETIHYDSFVYLLYLGAVLAISFYNLFLFFYLKKRVYLYYFVYSFCFGMWAAALFGGVGFYVIPIGWNYPLHIIASASLICFILFSNEVLQIQNKYPRIFFFLRVNIVFLIIVGAIIPFNIALGFITVNTVSSYLFLLFLFISSRQVYEGDKVARLYLIAIGVFLITISLLSLMGMGLLPNTAITRYSFLVGSFIEIILFSLLLAYRMDVTQRRYQADLKSEINKQTIHINKKNIVLQKLLRKKEELLKEMFHRVKNNFQILISMLYLEINDEKSALVNQKVERVIHKLHSMSIVHDMLYANSQNTTVNAKQYFEKLASHLIMKDTEVIVKVQSFEMDEQVAKNLGLIVNELFINSVKYTDPEHENKIYLSIFYDEKRVYFEYLDNTYGYAQSVQKGYGTQFINEIIDKLNNSSFVLDTKDKVHYKVSFTL